MFSPVEGGFWFSLTRPQQSWPALSGVCTRTRARRPQNRQFWGVLHRSLQGSEKILRGFTSRLLRSMPNFWCQTKVWVVKIYPQFQQSKMSWTRPRCTSCVTWNKNCLVICTYIYILSLSIPRDCLESKYLSSWFSGLDEKGVHFLSELFWRKSIFVLA